MKRRALLAAIAAGVLVAGCGFKLRQAPQFAFHSIYVGSGSALGKELKRTIAASDSVKVSDTIAASQVVLDVINEQREKVVVGLNATGQVREFELRIRVRFKLRTPDGKELIPETEIIQTRDISFNESAALAKETEEQLLYRDMQADIVQQLMRRLAAVKSI